MLFVCLLHATVNLGLIFCTTGYAGYQKFQQELFNPLLKEQTNLQPPELLALAPFRSSGKPVLRKDISAVGVGPQEGH